jgi:DNA mismatch repair protein MutL
VLARVTARVQHIYLNGRPIRDKTIQHALREAYRGLIEPGRYPTVVLMLEMDPAAVDVNVHPTKSEVRFRDTSLVHSVVLRAVRDALQRADLTPSVGSPGFGGPAAPALAGGPPRSAAGGPGDVAGSVAGSRFVDYFTRPVSAQPEGRFSFSAIREAMEKGATGEHGLPRMEEAGAGATGGPLPPTATPPDMAIPRPERALQVHNSYVVTEDEQGLVIVDQHALHERVMFEMLLDRVGRAGAAEGAVEGTGLESQRMLVPVVVPATARQIERLPELAALLARIGILVEPMGPTSVGVHAFPTFLFDRHVDAGEFTRELLERTDDEGFIPGGEEALHEVLDMMACKAAVKAGDHMSEGELRDLLRMREAVERSSNCPHGRPTSIRVTIKELERRFGRA